MKSASIRYRSKVGFEFSALNRVFGQQLIDVVVQLFVLREGGAVYRFQTRKKLFVYLIELFAVSDRNN